MRTPLLATTLLFGCSPSKSSTCMTGYTLTDEGHCMPVETVESTEPDEPEPTDTGTQEDTATPATVARGECEVGGEAALASVELIARTDTDEGPGPPTLLIELLDVAIDGDRFWGVGQGGLMSFDLTGSAPELDGVYPEMGGRYYRLLLIDHTTPLVYVTHRDQGLVVVDRSDPSNLRPVHSLTLDGLGGLAMHNDRVYGTKHDGSIVVFDASIPDEPTLLSTITAPGHPWNVVATSDALYTADNTEGLGVFDGSDADEPRYERHIDLGSGALDLALHEDTLFVAAGSAGLILLETSNPLEPTEIARLHTGSPVIDVSVSASTAWIVDHEAVWAIDVSDTENPTVIGRMETPRFAMTVAADGDDAWVGDWTAVGGYRAHPDRVRSTMVAHPDTVRLAPDTNEASLRLVNLGPMDGQILAWDASEPAAEVTVANTPTPSGEGSDITIEWPEDSDFGQICIQTDDPTTPAVEVTIQRVDNELSVPLGTAAPDFELTSLDGETVRLSEQLGHPVLLVYFATW